MTRAARRQLGIAVWLVGFAVVLGWSAARGRRAVGVGYGFAPPVEVAALQTGRIAALPVALHESVAADQVLVRLDDRALRAEIAVSRELLAGEEERLARTDARRFAEYAEGARVERAVLASRLAETEAALTSLRERAAVDEGLLTTGAVSGEVVAEWRRTERVLAARIAADRRALGVASAAAVEAAARSEAAQGAPMIGSARLVDLEQRLDELELRSGIDGQVTWLYRRPGEVVPAGEPVLAVQPRSTREVLAFLTPAEASRRTAGEVVTIERATGEVLRGEVLSVGVGPQPLPDHLWRVPGVPQRGVPIRVRIEGEVGPDEPVTVRI